MGAKEVSRWKRDVICVNGNWVSDAFEHILGAMDIKIPSTATTDMAEEYRRLVEVAMEYLKDHPDTQREQRLFARIKKDVAEFDDFMNFQKSLGPGGRFKKDVAVIVEDIRSRYLSGNKIAQAQHTNPYWLLVD